MDAQRASGIRFITILGISVVLLASVGAGASSFDVSMTAPSEVSVNERVTIGGEITVPDQPGTYETDVTVRLEIDGTEVSRQTVTVQDGETTQVSFFHQFDSAGDHRVRLIGETSFAGYTYSDDAITTITATAPNGATTPTVDRDPTPTVAVSSDEFTGAVVPVPESLREDVDAYRTQTGDVGAYAFVLITESDAYIVFSTSEPEPGRARVTGHVLTSDAVARDDLQFGAIAATDVTVTTEVESVSVSELREYPEEYAREVVRVTDHHQQAAVLYDPDSGANVSDLNREPP